MPATQLGALPANQQNALPLLTVQAATNGILNPNVGGGMIRYWDSTALGVTAAARVVVNTRNVIASNYIDVSGCLRFACLIRRVGGALAIVVTYTLEMQYRFSATDAPPAGQPATLGAFSIAKSSLNTGIANNVFPDPATLANATNLHTWSADETVGNSGTAGMMGSDVRLIINWDTSDPGVGNTFSMTLWGSS